MSGKLKGSTGLVSEQFGESYFYGKTVSNYSNYEKLKPRRQFRSVTTYIKKERLNGTFLDVGCAFGNLVKEVSPHFDELHGCDVSQFAISKANRRVPEAEFRVADIGEELPYPDGMFDCITALDVLEHTESLERSFSNLTTKLKPGGHLILSVPIYNLIWKTLGFLDRDETHVSILPKAEIMRIVRKNDMKVVRKRYHCSFPLFYKVPYVPAEMQLVLRKA